MARLIALFVLAAGCDMPVTVTDQGAPVSDLPVVIGDASSAIGSDMATPVIDLWASDLLPPDLMPCRCAPVGAGCNSGGDCASGYCLNNVCVELPDLTVEIARDLYQGCGQGGFPCCDGGICNKGVCVVGGQGCNKTSCVEAQYYFDGSVAWIRDAGSCGLAGQKCCDQLGNPVPMNQGGCCCRYGSSCVNKGDAGTYCVACP